MASEAAATTTTAAEELKAPLVLDGRYALERELGRGGMGQVFSGRDLKLERAVAVKVLRRGLQRPEAAARFAREARNASSLSHPNVLAVHDAGTADGRPYLVSELLHGETLRARLARGPLPLGEALGFATLIARGIAAAHARSVVHRDLKPDNIFITAEGWVKILDFGISKLLDDASSEGTLSEGDEPATGEAGLTSTGAFLGTPGYAAPEQIRAEPIDARADLFSFGAVVYEMIAGRRAFQGATREQTMWAVVHREPAPLPGHAAAVAALVDRCLRKRPEQRVQTARELVAELEALLPTTGIGTPPSHGVAPPARARRAWQRWTLAGLAALATVAAGAWAWASLRARPAPTAAARRFERLARDGTRSAAALRAFLAGEEALTAGDRFRALQSFRDAVAADAQFGLAYYRVATTARDTEPGLARDAIRGAFKADSRLEQRERRLLEAQAAADQGEVARALRIYREITAAHPDDVEAWNDLGGLLFAFGPVLGWPVSEAAEALRQALVLSPFDLEPLRRLTEIAQAQEQREVVLALTDRYATAPGVPAPVDVRWSHAWATGDEAQRLAAIEGAIASDDLDAQQKLFLSAASGDPRLADARLLAGRLAAAATGSRRGFWLTALAVVELARARPSRARANLAEAAAISSSGSLPHFAAWLETLDFVSPTAAQLDTARGFARQMNGERVPDFVPMKLYLEGTLAVRAGDPAAAERAARQLEALRSPDGTSVAKDLATGVRARALAAAGRSAEALAALEQQTLRVSEHDANLFSRISEQRLRAALLESAGRYAEAERWEVTMFETPLEIPLVPAVRLHLCELALRRGDFAAAAVHGAFAASAWSEPDAEMAAQARRAQRCSEAARVERR